MYSLFSLLFASKGRKTKRGEGGFFSFHVRELGLRCWRGEENWGKKYVMGVSKQIHIHSWEMERDTEER